MALVLGLGLIRGEGEGLRRTGDLNKLHAQNGKIYGKEMIRKDKYGRGSAAANGEGFVDLAPGDTFAALEAQLKRRIAERFDNLALGISASIGSKRNASELAKHLASGEEEEAHKFAAKNIGVLFAKGGMGVVHFDKKAVDETREKPEIFRVFSPFVFAGEPLVATITIKPAADGLRLYAIEALDIMRGERLEVHLAAEPRQFKTSRLLLTDKISYYVGDVNRTHPKFIGRDELFSIERMVELLERIVQDSCAKHQAPSTRHQAPKFSIIIPVYNVAPYLRECLDSVLAQTFTDWEAICVDDGSTDGSGAILDEYAAKDDRFRVIHQQNAGVSAARNAALDVVRGEWIAFLDGDDAYDCRLLSELVARMAQFGDETVEVVTFADYHLEIDGSISYSSRPNRLCGVMSGKEILRDGLGELAAYTWACWDKVYRRDLLMKNRISFEVGVSHQEDNLFCIKVMSVAERVLTCDDLFYYMYRQRPGSAMHVFSRSMFISQIKRNEVLYNWSLSHPSVELDVRMGAEFDELFAWRHRGDSVFCSDSVRLLVESDFFNSVVVARYQRIGAFKKKIFATVYRLSPRALKMKMLKFF